MTWDIDFSQVGKEFWVEEDRGIGFIIKEHMVLGQRTMTSGFESDRYRVRNRVFELKGITHLRVRTKESQVGDRLSNSVTRTIG